ncbi:MAG TPA: transposase [Streptosporangiaceae bacterium]|nr:transposase [Streptosporangiaceae bacterium]
MLQETQDREEIIERVAALDIGKAEVVCCARVPDEGRPGRRLQEVETYPAMTRSLLGLADRLASLGVTRVVMEATSDYWKPVFYVLEAAGFETWLVNARDVKHLPGRPKTGQAGRGLAVQSRRTADDPPEFRATAADPPAAGCHPVPDRPGRGAGRGEEPGREAAGRCPDQAERRGQRHFRGRRAGR